MGYQVFSEGNQNKGSVMPIAEKPIKKAFIVSPPKNWFDTNGFDIKYGDTASKVRYQTGLEWEIDTPYWMQIIVHRSPADDLFEPRPLSILSALSDEQKHIIAHSNGNGSSSPGHREYYNCNENDSDLLKLVAIGLMLGPQKSGMLAEGSAYFFLTKKGKEAALSMLPRRRDASQI